MSRLNDQNQERRILWSDGSPVDFAQWAPGEPNACDANNQCADGEDFVEVNTSRFFGSISAYDFFSTTLSWRKSAPG